MSIRTKILSLCLAAVSLALSSCATSPDGLGGELPEPRREFRAAWVATVANIDWPSKPGLPVPQQKSEAISILDRAVELNMNAIVFQVRPHADALYISDIEPWSYYLTGQQGKAPDPLYDPLQFWIDEAHARGLELHAWFNPYRAHHPIQKNGISPESIVKTRPDLAKPLKPSEAPNCFYWMDPGEPEVQDISRRVMMDVATRYDVDGIHIDDYFYPYPSYLEDGMDFPDDESYEKFLKAGGTLDRDDWRRKNVNDFVESFYAELRAETDDVQFGISPFGIWRPYYPPQIRGFDQYAVLYADAKLWLNEGWVDYYTPQLYWPIEQEPQSYTALLKFWADNNYKNRHLWPGNGWHSVATDKQYWDVEEAINQVKVTREQPGATGNVVFSMKHLMPGSDADKLGLGEELMNTVWADQALPPASPWLDSAAPERPIYQWADGALEIIQRDADHFNYVVYTKINGQWDYMISPASQSLIPVEWNDDVEAYAIRAADRRGNLSIPVYLPRRIVEQRMAK